MDDFAVQVRQIGQYPFKPVADPTDCVLLQQGGAGGPYQFTNPQGLLRAMGGAAGIAFGILPSPALKGIASSFITTPLGQRQGYNWYVDTSGITRYLQNGVAGLWSFADTQLSFSIAASGIKDAAVQFSFPLLQLGYDGQMKISQQLEVGRNPGRANEVVTLDFLAKNSVASFNCRTGMVTLQASDLYSALGLDGTDPLATVGWVNGAICNALNSWYLTTPLVYSFNGRVGTICLLATDVSTALMNDPLNSRAPSPAFGDSSTRIATTLFVDESVQDLQDWIIEQNYAFETVLLAYAPLESPVFTGYPQAPTASVGTSTGQLATTAFVMAAVASGVAGVASFNTRTGAVTLTLTDVEDVGGAPLDSPAFTGTPMAPTAAVGTSTQQLATTAFVLNEVGALSTGVTSFNGRTGLVTLSTADITGAGGAPIVSPSFTGTPVAPTAAPGTSTTQLATTAFVMANAGVTSFNGRTGAITLTSGDVSAAGGAPLNSPPFTGTPTAPTAPAATSTTQLATTAFVANAISAAGGVTSFNTRAGAVTLTAADVAAVATPPTITVLTSGSGTYTTKAGVKWLRVRLLGGGAGGGGGGGSGGLAANGGNTTFGSTLTAGGALVGGTAINVGTPGVASGGDINISGGAGSWGGQTAVSSGAPGGAGGNSAFGGGGAGGYLSNGSNAAPNSGGGGAGGSADSSGGAGIPAGTGGSAGAYCEKIIINPAATYAYSVGVAGGGGVAGSNGSTGGAGAYGIIIIDEHYGS
jgi:hypothetical protein